MSPEDSQDPPVLSRPSLRVAVDPTHPDQEALSDAGAVIRSGGLVAFPTETVYGLGAHALDPVATAAIFEAKGRPSTDPLIVHVANIDQARALSQQWDYTLDRLVNEFWPGPLTVVVRKDTKVPDSITAGMGTVALRVPAHPVAHGLILAAGVPVAAPSANRFGRISPTTADAVEEELHGRYDLLLDAGATTIGVESTVVSFVERVPVVLRHGGVTMEQLGSVLGEVAFADAQSQPESVDAAAPGQFIRHYSPSTPVLAVDGDAELVEHVRSTLVNKGLSATAIDLPLDPTEAARCLYSRLRQYDGDAQVLLVGMLDNNGLGRAVNDRLFRSACGNVISQQDMSALETVVRLIDSQ